MRKTKLVILLCLFMASQAFAQQSSSFAEYWFGVKPQTGVQKSTKTTVRKTPAKTKQRATKANGVITLDLSQPVNPETFEFDAKGYWTEIFNYKDYPFIEFNTEETMSFTHKYAVFQIAQDYAEDFETEEELDEFMADMYLTDGFWEGFTLSKSGDSSEQSNWVGNDGGNMAGGGIKTDAAGNVLKEGNVVLTDKEKPYLVGYASDMSWAGISDPSLQTFFYDTYKAKGMYVNLSPWMYYFNISGDAGSGTRPLNQEGDSVKLIIRGLNEDWEETGKTVVYVLATYHNGQLIQSPNWEWVDLSALGEVAGLSYDIESPVSNTYGILTPTYFCMDKLQIEAIAEEPAYNFTITVPEDADVYVGAPDYSGYNYRPFTEKEAVGVLTIDGKKTYYYDVIGKHNYRVKREGALTQVGVFTPSTSSESLEITEEQLSSHNPKDTDRDVTNNSNYNVADIFLNINEKGLLNLASGETRQLVNLRTWTMVDGVVSNYFLEPDYHYTVIDENGDEDNSVVTVDDEGKLTATGNGTAIVLVTYDAVNAHHAAGGPFFGALWAENTGVFVVSVGASASNITSGMLINETLNTTAESKLAATAVDAELDVFYYLEETGGYDYTFTPTGATSVSLAQPVVGTTMTSYNGFAADKVTNNGDGSYTVRLINGRNIVKLTSATGDAYQVLTAKAVNYTVSNLSNPDGEINPGDEISVKFNTLYHPCNKLAGVYNMAAGVQYNGIEANFSPYGGAGQYTFASRAQEYKITIPEEFEEAEFLLSNGVIKASGYGSPYGDHRKITLENGAAPNLNAAMKTAYFGALPDIRIALDEQTSSQNTLETNEINVYPNPFTDYIEIETASTENVTIYNIFGQIVFSQTLKSGNNRIALSSLDKGMYLLKAGKKTVKILKTGVN